MATLHYWPLGLLKLSSKYYKNEFSNHYMSQITIFYDHIYRYLIAILPQVGSSKKPLLCLAPLFWSLLSWPSLAFLFFIIVCLTSFTFCQYIICTLTTRAYQKFLWLSALFHLPDLIAVYFSFIIMSYISCSWDEYCWIPQYLIQNKYDLLSVTYHYIESSFNFTFNPKYLYS